METSKNDTDTEQTKRSYRTYEEWKRHTYWITNKAPPKFLPYLWGMETKKI